ncbi:MULTISPECIES: hypothetical protein [Shewanella]|uniref:DUF4870 domain-containing protein n=1 Tax=Shewanella japonica TaxID=93973 RepID=A0ABN4YEU3_9GAMM|nr:MULTISPECIES: hypothetical protein [Shewanella]ARD21575.1 hypothetical protein SJ2017_1250 [Shewanella japonica]KPZ68992.1 hypothetical protein AN944_03205 [Shewanella sp. P1-14-1]MBQ4888627.1 hypothetical protein [Shewanella sp. MMG014]OBT09030.1 hypothetical protein A9267_08390 [Shewanella sp. UCD-FRSSP16_17]
MTETEVYTAEDLSLGHFLYALMSAFPLFFLPVFFSLLINLSQTNIATHSLLSSHLRWQRNSITGLVTLLLIGYFIPLLWLSIPIFLAALTWFSYRIFKGWLGLNDSVNMY